MPKTHKTMLKEIMERHSLEDNIVFKKTYKFNAIPYKITVVSAQKQTHPS
jgi:hypothetical protein